jgi:hypothetical protein
MSRCIVFVAAIGAALALRGASAQQPADQVYVPRQADRPAALEGNEPGYRTIFDGKTLTGWEGDSRYWRVEDGSLVGEISAETVIKSNTFIIWRGGRPRISISSSIIESRQRGTAASITGARSCPTP